MADSDFDDDCSTERSYYNLGVGDNDDGSDRDAEYDDDDMYYENPYDVFDDDDGDDNDKEYIGKYVVKTSRNIRILFDNADTLLLEKARVEYAAVLRNVQHFHQSINPSNSNKVGNLTRLQLFSLFFNSEMRGSITKWVDDFSPINTLNITMADIMSFIRVDLMVQYYRTSVSHMYDKEQRTFYNFERLISEKKYHYIMRCLNNNRKKNPDNLTWTPTVNRSNEIITLFELFGRNCSKIGFIIGTSMIALDDDLWRLRSKKVAGSSGMQINNPKKGMGVTHHAAVSVTTGIYCGGYVQHKDDTTSLCVTNIQKILCQSTSADHINLQGTIFFMDRGYGGTDGDIIASLIQRGGHIHGTAKRMKSYPFSFGTKNVSTTQVDIPEYGAFRVYEATTNVDYFFRIKNG